MGRRSKNQGERRQQTICCWKGVDVLPLVAANSEDAGENVMSIQGEQVGAETSSAEAPLDQWQLYFSKQFNNLFHQEGKIRNNTVPAEFPEKLIPGQQKGRRIPKTLQEKVDKKISKLLKLEESSDKYLVSQIVILVKKGGSVKLALESREFKN